MKRLLAVMTVGLAVAGASIYQIVASSASAAGTPNRITTTCGFVNGMLRQVDPVVSHGIFPSAHPHELTGPEDLDQNSDSGPDRFPIAVNHENDPGYHLNNGVLTSCFTYGAHQSWWAPEAFINGARLVPYLEYETWQSPAGSTVSPPPFGATMVIGDAHATAPEDNHVTFNCGSLDGPQYPKPMDCTSVPGGVVTAQTIFPDCWDGSTAFDGPAGIAQSHFAYSTAGVCPSGMVNCSDGTTKPGTPWKMIAQLVTRETFRDPANPSTQLRNPNDAAGNLAITFASGPYYTYHSDVMMTWSTEILGNMVDGCLNHGHNACASTIGGIAMIGFTTGPGLT